MTVRVASSTTWASTKASLNATLAQVQRAQEQAGSGQKIARWSDDPGGAGQASALRAEQAAWVSYGRQGADAKARLDAADGALQSMSDDLSTAQSLGVSALGAAMTPASRAAIADELDALAASLRDTANAGYLGSPLLGGTADRAVASTGWVGNSDPVLRQVGPGELVDVSVDGERVLGFDGPAGSDVLSRLSALAQAVRTGDTAGIQTGQQALATAHDRVLTALGGVGAASGRVSRAEEAGASAAVTLNSQRSEIEEISLPAAVLALQSAETAYQAALGAAAAAKLPSLVSFLR